MAVLWTRAPFLLPVLPVAALLCGVLLCGAMLCAPFATAALAQGPPEGVAASPSESAADPSAPSAQTFSAPAQPTSTPPGLSRQTPPRTGPKEILVTGARVAEYGLYAAQVFRGQPSGALVNGIRDDASDYRLAARTARVVVRRGTAIGLGYVITGRPAGALVPVEVVVTHPPLGRAQANSGQGQFLQGQAETRSVAEYERPIGALHHALWTFEAGLVPGVYAISVRCQGQELARRAFSVRVGE